MLETQRLVSIMPADLQAATDVTCFNGCNAADQPSNGSCVTGVCRNCPSHSQLPRERDGENSCTVYSVQYSV